MWIVGPASFCDTVVSLVDGARSRLVLASARFEPWPALLAALDRAVARRVDLTFVLGGGERRAAHEKALRRLASAGAGAAVAFFDPLPGRYYVSDSEAIVTSLDLVDAPAGEALETAVCFADADDPMVFGELSAMVGRFLVRVRDRTAALPARRAVRRWEVAPEGYCIRCRASVPANPDRPLCRDCFESWAESKNDDYPEKYCLACGGAGRTSMRKALCDECYVSLYA